MKNYDVYYTFDEPVPYKKLKIYPAKMKDYWLFNVLAEILVIDKNSIPDINVIQMSYLDYIFYSHTEENYHIYKLDALLKMVLRDDELEIKYAKDEKNKTYLVIDDEIYDSGDFEEIRKIICDYNEIEMIDESISKEVRDKMREADRLRMKVNGNKMGSLEDQIVAIMISTSLSVDDVKELSIRKFSKILERADLKLHYEIYLSASMSGFVKFKDNSFIKHWLSGVEKDKFAGRMVEYNEVKNKINFGSQ